MRRAAPLCGAIASAFAACAIALAADSPPAFTPPGGAPPPAVPAPVPSAPVPATPMFVPPAAPKALVTAPVVVDQVAVVINEEIITLSDMYAGEYGAYIAEKVQKEGESARVAAEREVLEKLIEARLIAQEMERLQITPSATELESTIQDVARRNGLSVDQLRAEVEKSGMSWSGYRAELQGQLEEMRFVQGVLRPRISLSEDEIRDAWLRSTDAAEQVAALDAIFLAWPKGGGEIERAKTKGLAADIVKRSRAGEDFIGFCKQFDQGGYAEKGGHMGSFHPGEMSAAIDRAVFAATPGSVLEPIELPQGLLVIRVTAFEADRGDFEAARERVTEQVWSARVEEERKRWYQQTRRQATIRVMLPAHAALETASRG